MTILGVHSLGGAHDENSGYRGKFTGKSNNGFSEIYYSQMLNKTAKWKNVVCNIGTRKRQNFRAEKIAQEKFFKSRHGYFGPAVKKLNLI